jgi:hypothetical protein
VLLSDYIVGTVNLMKLSTLGWTSSPLRSWVVHDYVLLQGSVMDIMVSNFPTAIVVSNSFPATTMYISVTLGS